MLIKVDKYMQLKSFLCLAGLDNSKRFASISGLTYFALLLSVALVGPTAALYFVALLLAPVLALTTLRRLRDSGKGPQLLALTLLPFLLVLVTLVHIHSVMLLLTFVLVAALAVGYLAILPAVTSVNYVQGYSGPVDMRSVQPATAKANHRVRVEPTLGGEDVAANLSDNPEPIHRSEQSEQTRDTSIDQRRVRDRNAFDASQLQKVLLTNKKPLFITAASLVVVMLVTSIWSLIPESTPDDESAEQIQTEPATKPQATRVLTAMPDGFSLVLEDEVLIMRWLGETGAAEQLWSLATAKGDKTCSGLRFNNGTEYRPMVVDLLPDSATEARFSPLDTEAIIIDMARRGNVSVCGYNFSLKGSQAALGKVAEFRRYL